MALRIRQQMLAPLSADVKSRIITVANWDLDRVRSHVAADQSWKEDFAALVEREYRKFICLLAINPGKRYGMPACAVDDFWHHHLIHSRDYSRLCGAAVGRYIHHDPTDLNECSCMAANALIDTYNDLMDYYGEMPNQIWPTITDTACSACATCKAEVSLPASH